MTAKSKLKPMIISLILLFLLLLLIIGPVTSQSALPTIVINSDGTIDPPNASINRNGDLYTFAEDLYARIILRKGNVVIDGAGHTLKGPYNGTKTDIWIIGEGPDQPINRTLVPWVIGIDQGATGINNVTIKNLNIKNFSIGVYIWTKNNILMDNVISDNIVGILLSGSDNNIIDNYISANDQGIFFGINQPGDIPLNIQISGNSFIDNRKQLSGCLCGDSNITEEPHTWDNGEKGNYWSDYNGTDRNGDGIGDTPHIIDTQNKDRFPLIQIPTILPTLAQQTSTEIATLAVLILLAIVISALILRRRKNKQQTPEGQ